VIVTLGGAICGYSEIGSRKAAMAPTSVMAIEITAAKTGRSMKKRARRIVASLRLRRARCAQPEGTERSAWP
jgi:hypothetical protein